VQCGSEIDEGTSSFSLCRICLPASRLRRIKSYSKLRYGGRLEEIIERDRACVICGLPYGTKSLYGAKKNIERQVVVCHHIDGDITHNDPSNLIMLCFRCHSAVEIWKRLSVEHRQNMQEFLLRYYPISI
jgi:5-methylcytosine-specific restriction endonuclease McrA